MKSLVLILLPLMLVACSPSPDSQPVIAETARKAMDDAKAVEGTVQQSDDETQNKIAEGARKAMDDAKAVEGKVQQSADETQKQIDEQSQ